MYKASRMLCAALALVSAHSFAWELDNNASALNFSSTKQTTIIEQHNFGRLIGSISEQGGATVHIDLRSVETNIAVRNERMQAMLFETDNYPMATITAGVETAPLKTLKTGEHYIADVQLLVSLHGHSQRIKTQLKVVALSNNRIEVTNVAPIVINAEDFALQGGIAALQKVAKLASINTAVPVNVKLVFDR